MVDRVLRAWTEEWIVNSGDVAAFVEKAHAVPSTRVSVIRNGTDTSTFYPASERRAGTGPAKVGSVGRLVPEKGLDVLLKAMPYVLSRRPVVLTVAGEGPERSRLERRAEGLPVTFVGHLNHPSDVASFLRSIDVFVMPSRWEGLPNALLEALACGVPAVATDVSGMAEAAAKSALLVPPDQPVALANAICRALDSDPRPAIALRSFDEVAADHAEVFERARARLMASHGEHV
jgi:glycosyltransferase involved in cell wall biosynthesis